MNYHHVASDAELSCITKLLCNCMSSPDIIQSIEENDCGVTFVFGVSNLPILELSADWDTAKWVIRSAHYQGYFFEEDYAPLANKLNDLWDIFDMYKENQNEQLEFGDTDSIIYE